MNTDTNPLNPELKKHILGLISENEIDCWDIKYGVYQLSAPTQKPHDFVIITMGGTPPYKYNLLIDNKIIKNVILNKETVNSPLANDLAEIYNALKKQYDSQRAARETKAIKEEQERIERLAAARAQKDKEQKEKRLAEILATEKKQEQEAITHITSARKQESVPQPAKEQTPGCLETFRNLREKICTFLTSQKKRE